MFPEENIKIVTYYQEQSDESKLPTFYTNYIRREDMKIKDVDKNLAMHSLPSIS